MRRILRYCVLAAVLLLVAGCFAPATVRTHRPWGAGKDIFPLAKDIAIEQPQQRLPEYAQLTYQVRWSGVPVGYLVNTIKGIQQVNGRDCYVLETVMKTNAVLSFIFPVTDRFTSFMDVEKKHSLRHVADVSEGKYRRNSVTDYDQEKHMAHFKNFRDNSEKEFEILPDTQDVITAYYYLMLLPVTEVGDKIEFNGTNTGLKYKLRGEITSKVFIKVPAYGHQAQNAFVVRMNLVPEIKGKKIEEGVSDVYFSSAKERFPLYAVIKGPVFTEVTAALVKIDVKVPEKPAQPAPAAEPAPEPSAVAAAEPAAQLPAQPEAPERASAQLPPQSQEGTFSSP